jgi:hypothetical protein
VQVVLVVVTVTAVVSTWDSRRTSVVAMGHSDTANSLVDGFGSVYFPLTQKRYNLTGLALVDSFLACGFPDY